MQRRSLYTETRRNLSRPHLRSHYQGGAPIASHASKPADALVGAFDFYACSSVCSAAAANERDGSPWMILGSSYQTRGSCSSSSQFKTNSNVLQEAHRYRGALPLLMTPVLVQGPRYTLSSRGCCCPADGAVLRDLLQICFLTARGNSASKQSGCPNPHPPIASQAPFHLPPPAQETFLPRT